MVMGCASAPAPGPEPVNRIEVPTKEEKVRVWMRTELVRIYQKRDVVDDMFKTGQIGYTEYFLLLEECDAEKRALPGRARILFN